MNAMKGYLLIGIGVLIVIAGIIYFFLSVSNTSTAVPNPIPGLPVASSTQQAPVGGGSTATTTGAALVNLPARGTNQVIVANDFINNGQTAADVQNPGTYYLAGSVGYCLPDGTCPSGVAADNFIVTYDTLSQSFTIVLTKEPLGLARQGAEQFLLKTLGVSQGNLCNLKYYLGTTSYVSSIYGGKNLGFSFCLGATSLPN